jgi:hypothetical protein
VAGVLLSWRYFLHSALSERLVACRFRLNLQWPASNYVTSLHCFLLKASRAPGSWSEDATMKCLMCGTTTKMICISDADYDQECFYTYRHIWW